MARMTDSCIQWTRQEFEDEFGKGSIVRTFQLTKLLDIKRIRIELMLNPNIAIQMKQYATAETNFGVNYVAINVKCWLNRDLDVCFLVDDIRIFHSFADYNLDIASTNEIKLNQN